MFFDQYRFYSSEHKVLQTCIECICREFLYILVLLISWQECLCIMIDSTGFNLEMIYNHYNYILYVQPTAFVCFQNNFSINQWRYCLRFHTTISVLFSVVNIVFNITWACRPLLHMCELYVGFCCCCFFLKLGH